MDWVSKITCELLRNKFLQPPKMNCMADKVSMKFSLGCMLDGNMRLEPSSLSMRFSWAWATKWSSALPPASHKDHIIPQFYILWVPTNQVACKTGPSLCKRCMNIADKLRLLTAFSLHGNKLLSAQLWMMKKFPTCTFPAYFLLVLVFLNLLCGNQLPPTGR